jgi:hypothetical protein
VRTLADRAFVGAVGTLLFVISAVFTSLYCSSHNIFVSHLIY